MIKTLILDIGGIIRKESPRKIHEDIANYFNLDVVNFLDVFLPMLDKIRVGEITESQLWSPVISKFNLNTSPEELSNKYVEMHVDETHRYNLANVELLDFLKDFKRNREIQLVAFSNTNPLKARGMKVAGLLDIFDTLVFSHDIGYLKQDSNAYKSALEILQKSPDEMFFIDDKKENVEIAKEFGIDGAVSTDSQEVIRIIGSVIF